jgi:septum formation protein
MRQDSGPIILASSSPRRAALLASAGVLFTVVPSNIAEQVRSDEAPEDTVLRLARAKARNVAKTVRGRFFLGADTAVVIEGEVLGKPADGRDAERMLMRLSGRVHEVITGYEVYDKHADSAVRDMVKTRVFFKTVQVEEIQAYIASETIFDTAGGYAIQGRAACMVHRIEGSYTNVVGLPLCEVIETLVRMGAISWRARDPGGPV